MDTLLTLLAFALGALALPLLVCAAFLALQVLAARRYRDPASAEANAPPFVVLVPAHDEAALIGASLRALRPHMRACDELVVVADNCSDATAAIAAAHGARVLERHDGQRRGKGYALDHGLRALEAAPPAVVVMIDADCRVAQGRLELLAARAHASARPVQACYLIEPAGPSVGERIAAFAWRVRNRVRARGAAVLGLPCLLTGSGMAFPWATLREVSLASGQIVEDMQLGLDLALQGASPLYDERVLITSRLPADESVRQTQRRRWEHGHLALLIERVPALVAAAWRQRRAELLGLALHLGVPPLALLVAATLALTAAGFVLAAVGGPRWPLALAAVALALLALALVQSWRSDGRELLQPAEWLALPRYVLAKLPLYARFLARRESQWIRTRRDR